MHRTLIVVLLLAVTLACGDGSPAQPATPSQTTVPEPVGPPPVPRTVTGFVHESAPTEDVAIPGARINVTDSTGGEQSIVSDSAGRYSVTVASGPVQVSAAAAGYESASLALVDGAQTVSIGLRPVLREVRQIFMGSGEFVTQRTFSIPVHHSGELRTLITGCHPRGCGLTASAWAGICAEVRDASNRTIAAAEGQYDNAPRPFRIRVDAGQRYEVKLFTCPRVPPVTSPVGSLNYEIKHPS
jgi:hypothetical protein